MDFEHSIDINTSAERVWSVLADVERWPEWAPSMSEIRLTDGDRLALGARAHVRQPKLPPATWQVTEIEPGTAFTWETARRGMKIVARHEIKPNERGVTVTLAVGSSGLIARIVRRWAMGMAREYVISEAAGLKRRSEGEA